MMKNIFTSIFIFACIFAHAQTASLTPIDPLCNGDSDGFMDVSTSGMPNPFDWDLQLFQFGTYISISMSGTGQVIPNFTVPNIFAGTYRLVIYTDGNLGDPNEIVFISGDALVSQPAPITLFNQTENPVTCFGLSDGSAQVNIFGGTPLLVWTWTPNPSGSINNEIINVPGGTYSFSVTDANGCDPETGTVFIDQPASALSVNLVSSTDASCFAASDGSIDINVNGGTPGYTYSWVASNGGNLGANSPTAQDLTGGLVAGDYTCTITDASNCSETITETISEPADLDVTASSIGVLCNGDATGSIDLTVTVGTGTPGYIYSWTASGGGDLGSNSANDEDLTGLVAGNYSYSVTDANGCGPETGTVTITQPATALSVTSVGTNVTCDISADGTINLTVTGGTPGYTYSWTASGGGNLGANPASSEDLAGLIGGTYTCAITDANNCPANESITLTQPATFVATASVTDVNCNGGATGEIDISVTGGTAPYTYSWTASGGGSLGTNPSSNEDLLSLVVGDYSCVITDDNGCQAFVSQSVGQDPAITISTPAPSMVSCFGGSNGIATVDVLGGSGTYTYEWTDVFLSIVSTSANTGPILPEGTYDITVTDAINPSCFATTTVIVPQPPTALVVTSSSVPVTCFGFSDGQALVFATGGLPFAGPNPYTYQWSDGTNILGTSSILVAQAGTYFCTVTDDANCDITVSVPITEPDEIGFLAPGVSVTNPSCVAGQGINDDGDATVVPTGGTLPYSFAWNDPALQTTASATGLTFGTYTCVVTDANGCSPASASISGTLIDAIAINTSTFSFTDVLCTGDFTGEIILNVSGGTPNVPPAFPYQYAWSNGTNTYNNTLLPAGTYDCTVTDALGCFSNTGPIIIDEPATVLSATANVVDESCFGLSDGSVEITVIGGTPSVPLPPAPPLPTYSFTWSNGAPNSALATNLPGGNYTFTVTDANSCTYTDVATVASATDLIVTQNIVPPSCNSTTIGPGSSSDGTATLNVTGGNPFILGDPYSYLWSDGQVTQTAIDLSAGTYTCTVTDANDCEVVVTIVVPETTSDVTASFNTTDVDCFGESTGQIIMSVTGGDSPYSYSWSSGQISNILQNITAGTYTCNVTDQTGCITVVQTTINENSDLLSPISVFQMSVAGANDGSMFVTASGGVGPYTYDWGVDVNGNSLGTNASIPPPGLNLSAGLYTCIITDALGCSSQVSGVMNDPACNVQVDDNITDIDCYGGTAELSWTNSNGVAPYTNTLIDPNGSLVNLNAIFGTNQFSTTPFPLVGLAGGTYLLTVVDQNGCYGDSAAAINIQINEPAELEISFTFSDYNGYNVSCYGEDNGTVIAIPTGGTPPLVATFAVSGTGTPADPNALEAGTYSYTVMDGNGCMTDSSFVISEPLAPLTLSSSSTPEWCNPILSGTATVNPSGGTPGYTYDWLSNPTINSPTLNGLSASPNPYTCTVTDANGCQATEDVLVGSVPLLDIVTTSTNPTCDGSADGIITTTILSGTLPINYYWYDLTGSFPTIPISNASSISSLSEGTYELSATDAYGCDFPSVFSPVYITDPAPITFDSILVMPTINGACDGSITITNLAGGTAPYSFLWIGTGGYTSTNMDISSLCSGQYDLIITDANGCIANLSVNIIDPACNISAPFILTQPDCFGQNGDLTYGPISGGQAPYIIQVVEYATSFVLYSGSTTIGSVALPDGNYYLEVEDDLGCVAQISNIIVDEPLLLTASVQTGSVSCNGYSDGEAISVVLGGVAPYNYSWAGVPANNTNINTGLAAGPSSLVVTDANGCISNTAFYTISEPLPIIIDPIIFTEPTCSGDADGTAIAPISGGTGSYTYLWSPSGEITNPAIDIPAGIQDLLVTDLNGCLESAQVTITEPTPLATTIIATSVVCSGAATGTASAVATGGTAPYYYLWSNGGTTQSITGLVAGIYFCTVTDANGCAITVSKTITSSSSIVSNLVTNDVTCNGDNDGSASVLPAGGSGGALDVQWWDGTTNTNTVSNIAPGTYWVIIQEVGANPCPLQEFFIISEPDPITYVSSTDSTSCNGGADGTVTVTASGGIAPYTYTLLDEFGVVSGVSSSGVFTPFSAGTYTSIIVDANGCSLVTTIADTVFEPNPILANESITPITCFGGSDGSILITPTGENNDFTYFWAGSGNTTTYVDGLSAQIYNLTITPANGCNPVSFSYDISNYEPALITATITIDTEISCFGEDNGSATINVTGGVPGYSYLWNDPSGQTTPTVTGLTAGTYFCLVTDANGCSSTSPLNLIEPALVTTGLVVNNSTCNGSNDGNAQVFPGGVMGANFNVLFNNLSLGAINFMPLSTGTHQVEVINTMTGCSSGIETFTISEPAVLTASSLVLDVLCYGDATGQITAVVNGGTAPYTYLWDDPLAQTTEIATNLIAGTYSCVVTDANGCSETINSITISEPLEISANFSFINVGCFGGNDGQVTVIASGGNNTSYSYFWSNDTIEASNTSDGYTAAIGIYTVTITDGSGCSQTFGFDIQEPAPFTVSAVITSDYNGADVSCNGANDGEITITVNGGNSISYYDLNGIILSGSNIQSGLPADNYFIDAYDVNGCVSSTSIIVTEPASIDPNITITDVSCTGIADGVITVSPVGGTTVTGVYNVDWFNVGTVPSTYHGYSTSPLYPLDIFSGGQVIITDDNNCTDTSFVDITQPLTSLALTVSSTSPTCNQIDNGTGSSTDGTATVVVAPGSGTAPYSYLWSDGQIDSIATGLSEGTYSVTVTDVLGCTETITETIVAPDPLDAGLVVTPVTCLGYSDGTATLNPTGFQPGGYAILWSDGSSGNSIVGLPAFDPTLPVSVTITDMTNNQCGSITLAVVVPTPNSPLVAVVNPSDVTPPSCFGISDGQILLSAQGGVPPYTYAFPSLGISVSSLNPWPYSPASMGLGFYPAIVVDANGCQASISGGFDMSPYAPDEISPNALSGIDYNGFDIQCNGLSNGILESNPTGGTVVLPTDYSYNWIDVFGVVWGSPTSSVVPNVPAGSYTVTVTDNNGCTGVSMITLTEPPALTFAFSPSDYNGSNISCNGDNDGILSVTTTGGANGVDPNSYIWENSFSAIINSFPTNTVSSLVADTYTLTVSDNNGCPFSESYTMTEPNLLTTTTSVVPTICDYSSDGSAIANPIGGTIPYTYLWWNAGGQVTQTATGLQGNGALYNVIVTDINGCEAFGTAVVTSPAPIPLPSITVTDPTCNGYTDGSIFFTPLGGYSYTMELVGTSLPVIPIPSGSYNGLQDGVIDVIVTDVNGCVGISTQTVDDPPLLVVQMSIQIPPSCGTNADGVLLASPIGGSGSTTYDFVWTDDNGNLLPPPVGVPNPNNISVVPANGIGVTSTLSNLTAGQYYVQATETGANGCAAQNSKVLTNSTTLDINYTTIDVSCNNASDGSAVASLNPGNTASAVSWTDSLGNQIGTSLAVSNLVAGVYAVTITNQDGCTATETVTIIEPPNILSIQVEAWNLDCYQDGSGTALVTIVSPGEPFINPANNQEYYDIVWDYAPPLGTLLSNNLMLPDPTDPNPPAIQAADYQVTVTDAAGCVQTGLVTIGEPDPLTATITTSDISCNGLDNGEAISTIGGGTPVYSYTWYGPAGLSAGTNANIDQLAPGSYDLTVTDLNGCEITESCTIIEPPLLSAQSTVTSGPFGPNNEFDIACHGDMDGSVEIIVTGGLAPYNVFYNAYGPSTNPAPTTFTFSNLAAGNGTYTVTDANSCTYIGYESITEPPQLFVSSIEIEHPSCYGDADGSAIINVIGGVPMQGLPQYTVTDYNGVAFDLTGLLAGDYPLMIADAVGCEVYADFEIVDPLEILVDNQQCLDAITIDVEGALGNYAITWIDDSGALVGTGLTISDLEEGNYNLLIIDTNSCFYTEDFYLGLPSIIVDDATCNDSDDGSIDIEINGNSFYDVWINGSQISDDALLASAADLAVGVYEIHIVDEGNCDYSQTVTVGYDGGYSCVDPPIIISPNADGVNDTWIPASNVNEDISVTIYNRWGQIEFHTETNSSIFEWNGKGTDGSLLLSTDYFFLVRFINSEEMADKTGVITLIR